MTIDGASLIAQERRRQVEDENYSPEHDAQHTDAELLKAAMAYMLAATDPDDVELRSGRLYWPWNPVSFKPKAPIRNLVRAGALIAAEIDRLGNWEEAGNEGEES